MAQALPSPVLHDFPVRDHNGPLAISRHLFVVGHNDERDPFPISLQQELHDLFSCLAVQGPGRLISQEQSGGFDQRPRQGNTLLLTTGELIDPLFLLR